MRLLTLRALIGGGTVAALCAAPFLTAPAASASARPGPWDMATMVPAPASSAPEAGKLPPWQTYRSGSFSYAAGQVCSFALSGVPVKDQEQYRTLQYYPDGAAELNEYRGPLYVRFTNEATGRSVVRNLSGYGWFRFSDGTGVVEQGLFLNNGGISVQVGNQGYPSGYYVEHGQVLVTDNGQGSRVIHVIHATLENLCRTLGS